MKRSRLWILAPIIAALAVAPLGAQDFSIDGRQLSSNESAAVLGGETYVEINASRSLARVVTIPRDSYGMDYSRAACYSVGVHNNISDKLQQEKKDWYQPTHFPAGTVNMGVRAIDGQERQTKYGSSSGEWITTDAVTTVTAYPKGANGKADMSQPYTRSDSGYFWHANNEKGFSNSVSAGCLISEKSDIDRVISTLKNDRGPKRLTVHD